LELKIRVIKAQRRLDQEFTGFYKTDADYIKLIDENSRLWEVYEFPFYINKATESRSMLDEDALWVEDKEDIVNYLKERL